MQFLFFIGQSSRLYFISFLSYRHLFMTDINKSQVSKRIRVSSEVFDRISLLANNNSISVTQVVEKALDDYENNLQFPYSKKNYFLTQNIEMLNKKVKQLNLINLEKLKLYKTLENKELNILKQQLSAVLDHNQKDGHDV